MLKTLRTRLAKICMLITATLLAMMSLISLGILEKQFNAQQYTLIENQLNSIVFRLQTERSISHTFLSKLEATNQLLIKIEDNLNQEKYDEVLKSMEIIHENIKQIEVIRREA